MRVVVWKPPGLVRALLRGLMGLARLFRRRETAA